MHVPSPELLDLLVSNNGFGAYSDSYLETEEREWRSAACGACDEWDRGSCFCVYCDDDHFDFELPPEWVDEGVQEDIAAAADEYTELSRTIPPGEWIDLRNPHHQYRPYKGTCWQVSPFTMGPKIPRWSMALEGEREDFILETRAMSDSREAAWSTWIKDELEARKATELDGPGAWCGKDHEEHCEAWGVSPRR
jgi:hypothetical protein